MRVYQQEGSFEGAEEATDWQTAEIQLKLNSFLSSRRTTCPGSV